MTLFQRLLPRRTFLRASAAALTGALAGRMANAHEPPAGSATGATASPPADAAQAADTPAVPVLTPDIATLPFERDGGVKVFRLVAEPVKQEVVPGRILDLWGYNGSAPGPTIEVNEGDRVRFLFENRLPEPTTLHWHGLEVPIEMDGVPAISQPEVEPGGRFTYEFTVRQHGTFFYHSHGAMQEMMGMLGFFIAHPRTPYAPAVQRDYGIVLQEYAVLPSNTIPNSLAMEFNWLTFNGKVGPAMTPLLVKLGERVRIRLVNIGMDHHPVHLHGMQFEVTGTEGGRIPERLWYPQNTVLVGVAQARAIEFEAKYPGDWMLHCHLPHHMMNQMVSMVGPLGGHGQAAVPGARRVPGFPQDMSMPMDDAVAKPETHGMARGWTGAMQGMMTIVRVLPPDRYDEIMRRIAEAKKAQPRVTPVSPAPPEHRH